MNCHSDAAERGWEFFASVDPAPPLEEINRWLAAEALDPVSPRMYRHYRRLALHNFKAYVPINELDVRLKLAHATSS